MKQIFSYILLVTAFLSTSALACLEPNYCKRQDSLVYVSSPYIFLVEFKDKLVNKELIIPEEVKSKVRGKVCILECTKDKLYLSSNGRALQFKIEENQGLSFERAFPLPDQYKSKNTFTAEKALDRIEVYKSNNTRINFHVEDKEKHQTTDYGKLIIHSLKNKLIKSDLETGKESEELVVYEAYKDEIIHKRLEY